MLSMNSTMLSAHIAALAGMTLTAACTASQPWGESPEATATVASMPPTAGPSAPTVAGPIASAAPSASTATPEKKGVQSCKEVPLEATKGGSAAACFDAKGVVVVALWHVEGTGKAKRASGTIDRWQNGKQEEIDAFARSIQAVARVDRAWRL